MLLCKTPVVIEMLRKYKERSPEETIQIIHNILIQVGINPYVFNWCHPKDGLYSVRIQTSDKDSSFGTNGKGRTKSYALASGYAEFIERTQNSLLIGISGVNRMFLDNLKIANGFYYYPDEKFLSQKDFLSLPESYLADLFGREDNRERLNAIHSYFERLSHNGYPGSLSVPFFDCNHSRVVYLPLSLTLAITGSNGMAAGNTREEAIFQALCELIERFSAQKVYYDQLTPPTVDDSFLIQFPEEFRIIKEIRDCGFEVVVKDFSCGLAFPAIGVLIIDRDQNKYRLNVGADTSFRVALSRALTEIYQGVSNDNSLRNIMLEIPGQIQDYFISDSLECKKKRDHEIREFTINGRGVFPRSLFEDTPSYVFNPTVFTTETSYLKEVSKLIRLFSDNGNNVYIRDVSFLGFPSFYVYIPKVSRLGRKTRDDISNILSFEKNVVRDSLEDLVFPFDSFIHSPERIRKVLDILAPNRGPISPQLTMSQVLRLDFSPNSIWFEIPIVFVVSLLCFIVKEYNNSEKYLKLYMQDYGYEDDKYYLSVIRFIQSKEKENNSTLSDISQDIVDSFSSPESIFAGIGFPNCPHCNNCILSENCITKDNILFSCNIGAKMKKVVINQDNLSGLFQQ